jgi:cell division initiation protein
MLTPQELREKTFDKAMFGGYDMAGVDDFLDAVAGDYATLHKENDVLKKKLKVLVDKIEEYRATEDGLRKTILAAQKMSEEQLSETKEKCETMLREAEEKAADIIREAQDGAALEEARYAEAKKSSAQYIESIRLICTRQLEYLDNLAEAKASVVTPPAPEKKQEIPDSVPPAEGAWDSTVRSIEDSVSRLADEPELDVHPAVERKGIADSTDEPTRLFDFDGGRGDGNK